MGGCVCSGRGELVTASVQCMYTVELELSIVIREAEVMYTHMPTCVNM